MRMPFESFAALTTKEWTENVCVHCTSLGWWSKFKVQTCASTRNARNNERLGQQNSMRLTANMRLYAIMRLITKKYGNYIRMMSVEAYDMRLE